MAPWRRLPTTTARPEVDESYRDERDVLYCRFYVTIVGCQYYSGVIHEGEMASLVREPHNKYDRNAIRVDNMRKRQVGHIKRQFAATLAPILDDPSPAAPRLELVVQRAPSNMYTVDAAVVRIFGLPEYANVTTAYLRAAGIRVPAQPQPQPAPQGVVVRSVVQMDPARRSQEELDQVFDSLGDELKTLEKSKFAHFASACPFLTAQLLPHQVEGLAFLVSRESGFTIAEAERGLCGADNPKRPLPPLWIEATERGKKVYVNKATNSAQDERPPDVLGGILADDMGLGKTLQILALVANRPAPVASETGASNAPTLVVCPASVLDSWVDQAREHCVNLDVVAYRGTDRDKSTANLASADVVVTTYGVVAAEHAQLSSVVNAGLATNTATAPSTTLGTAPLAPTDANTSSTSAGKPKTKKPASKKRKRDGATTGLFAIESFHRIVLDEAHQVRNAKTKTFAACAALKGRFRWCLTGTPVVNRVEDVQALFAFLRAAPVDDPEIFKRAVSRPLREGDEKAVAVLRVLLRSLTLRRTKAILAKTLPPRTVETRYVDAFAGAPDVKDAYDDFFLDASSTVRALGALDKGLSHYSHILEVLTRLRQLCSGGASLVSSERRDAARRIAAALRDVGVVGDTKQDLDVDRAQAVLGRLDQELAGENNNDTSSSSARDCCVCMTDACLVEASVLRGCGHVYCGTCVPTAGSGCAVCGTSFGRADVVRLVPDVVAAESTVSVGVDDAPTLTAGVSAAEPVDRAAVDDAPKLSAGVDDAPKLSAVVSAVTAVPPDEKVVVFSSFLDTLNKCAARLRDVGVRSALITGSVAPAKRADIVREFQSDDPSAPRVLLISLKAGGVGLTLTRANHVFLLEPWWNAAVEDQACDRVHRIGQKKPVKAVKFVASRTVEERMLALQEAKSILSQGSLSKLSPEQLRKARLGEMIALFQPFDHQIAPASSSS